MKTRSTLIAILIAVAILATAPLVMARPDRERAHGFGGPGGGLGLLGHIAGHLKDELDLSDQQADEIKAIFADLHEQNAQYRDQMRGGFKEVADTLLANPNDIAAAQALLDKQAATEKAMKSNLLTATSKALSVLTPDQRAKLKTLMEEHMERRAERRGR